MIISGNILNRNRHTCIRQYTDSRLGAKKIQRSKLLKTFQLFESFMILMQISSKICVIMTTLHGKYLLTLHLFRVKKNICKKLHLKILI